MNWKDFKVRKKIMICFMVPLIFMVVIGVWSYISSSTVHNNTVQLKDESVVFAGIAEQMWKDVIQVQQWLSDISATRARDGLDDGFDEAKKYYNSFLSGLKSFEEKFEEKNDSSRLKDIRELKVLMDNYYQTGTMMANSYINSGTAEGNKIMAEFDEAAEGLTLALKPFLEEQINEVNEKAENIIELVNKLKFWTILISLLTALAVMLAALFVSNAISKPIKALHKGSEIIGNGNLDHRVGTDSKDEIGELSRTFDRMIANLKTTTASRDELNREVLERREVEKSLFESEERYRSVVETASDAIVYADSAGNIIFWNREAEKMFGYSAHEIIYRPFTDIMPDRYKSLHQSRFKRAVSSGIQDRRAKSIEMNGLKKNGNEFPVELSLAMWKCQEELFFTAIIRDITERKKLERSIFETEEIERRRIGYELHDGLGQLLAGISLNTKCLESDLKKKVPLEMNDILQINVLIDRAKKEVRKITRGISPIDLEKEGLKEALYELVLNTAKTFNVSCDLKCNKPVRINKKTGIIHLYRIAQEAVTNAVKHGGPESIEISLSRTNDKVVLRVEDDGIGYDVKNRRSSGIGTEIMCSRAKIIDASFDIRSGKGMGTVVECILYDAITEKDDSSIGLSDKLKYLSV